MANNDYTQVGDTLFHTSKVHTRLSVDTCNRLEAFKEVHGCYILVRSTGQALYIGETINMYSRLIGHEKASNETADIFIYPTQSRADNGWMKRYLISKYNPIQNGNHDLNGGKLSVCLDEFIPDPIVIPITLESFYKPAKPCERGLLLTLDGEVVVSTPPGEEFKRPLRIPKVPVTTKSKGCSTKNYKEHLNSSLDFIINVIWTKTWPWSSRFVKHQEDLDALHERLVELASTLEEYRFADPNDDNEVE